MKPLSSTPDQSGISKPVVSNQTDIHENLQRVVEKHFASTYIKPIQDHTLQAFEQAQQWLKRKGNQPIVLDSCCGVGESTYHLANAYPNALVIGIDKSALRIEKHENYALEVRDNYLVLQADVRDFWRLVIEHNWLVQHHYLLYPNPYPKSSQLTKRWHGHPAFVDLLGIKASLTVRSNWRLYVEEFVAALAVRGFNAQVQVYQAETPQTPFERKYWASGHQSWQTIVDLF